MMSVLEELIAAKRALVSADTNAFRVADGKPWPEIFIDAFADCLVVSLRSGGVPCELLDELEACGRTVYLKQLDRDVKLAPAYLAGPKKEPQFEILENGLRYLIDMEAGYSQGIFLDQRDNRKMLREMVRPGMRVLNTFAYTGAFSVSAAVAGAQTTTLDLARPCLDWCKRNMQLNGIDPAEHYFCKGDALHWMERFARQGRQFDIVVLDPPTFSRDEKGKIWRVESHYDQLVALASGCLAAGGQMLCTTNCRKLGKPAFRAMVHRGAPVGAKSVVSEMPADFDGEAYLKSLWVSTP